MISKFTLICIFGLFFVQNTSAAEYERDYLPKVQTLTFFQGVYTIGNKPVLQLQCKDLSDSVCSKYQIKKATCKNIGRVKQNMIGWECTAAFPKDIKFDALNVQCERFHPNDDDYIIRGSCALRYSLKDTSVSIGLIIFGVVVGVIIFVSIIACCVKCSHSTVYHDHAPVSVVSRPACGATSVYTVPVVAPAYVPTYYPDHHYHHTDVHVGFSGTTYRNDGYSGSHVDTGYAGTTYRDSGYTDTGYAGTTFDSGYTGGGDTGYAGTDFR